MLLIFNDSAQRRNAVEQAGLHVLLELRSNTYSALHQMHCLVNLGNSFPPLWLLIDKSCLNKKFKAIKNPQGRGLLGIGPAYSVGKGRKPMMAGDSL